MKRTCGRVAAYNVLICVAAACLGIVLVLTIGPPAGLVYLGVVACATPLGKVVWP